MPKFKSTKLKRPPIYHTVLSFRKGILGSRPSTDMCFVVCAPLQSYLNLCGYSVSLIDGFILDEDGNELSHHFWLSLSDGRIIDPTADQFSRPGRTMPKVYIGPLPEWYEAYE